MTDNGQTLHHGNCHCGRFRYQVYAPAITSAIACSCSLCQKKGYLWLDVGEKAAFSIVRDDGQTTEYESATIRDKVSQDDYILHSSSHGLSGIILTHYELQKY